MRPSRRPPWRRPSDAPVAQLDTDWVTGQTLNLSGAYFGTVRPTHGYRTYLRHGQPRAERVVEWLQRFLLQVDGRFFPASQDG